MRRSDSRFTAVSGLTASRGRSGRPTQLAALLLRQVLSKANRKQVKGPLPTSNINHMDAKPPRIWDELGCARMRLLPQTSLPVWPAGAPLPSRVRVGLLWTKVVLVPPRLVTPCSASLCRSSRSLFETVSALLSRERACSDRAALGRGGACFHDGRPVRCDDVRLQQGGAP